MTERMVEVEWNDSFASLCGGYRHKTHTNTKNAKSKQSHDDRYGFLKH